MSKRLELPAIDGLRLALPLAGIGSRFAAWFVDWLCSVALAVAVGKLAGLLIVFGMDAVLAARILGYFVSNVAYGIASEWLMRGQSVGKRLLGLRVVDVEGRKLEFVQVALRNLLRFADMLPVAYAVGGVSVLLSSRSQRLGDVIANTTVVALRPATLPPTEHLARDEWNSLWSDPLLVARLRQALDGEFALLGFDALLRRAELEPSARAQLFAELADAVRSRVPLPEAATRGQSDERLLRNVIDVLFRQAEPSARQVPATRLRAASP